MLVGDQLPDPALQGTDIRESSYRLWTPLAVKVVMPSSVTSTVRIIDHLAVIDVVRVAVDFLDEVEVLADQRGDMVDSVNMTRRAFWPLSAGWRPLRNGPRQQFP